MPFVTENLIVYTLRRWVGQYMALHKITTSQEVWWIQHSFLIGTGSGLES